MNRIKILARALRRGKLQWDGQTNKQTDRNLKTKVSAVTSTAHNILIEFLLGGSIEKFSKILLSDKRPSITNLLAGEIP